MPRHGVRFHNVPGGGAVGGEGGAEAARAAPELSLSTLEYYLFTFAWVRRGAGVDVAQRLQKSVLSSHCM